MKLLTWNVAGRTKLLPDQIAAVSRREPDLLALQEIRPSTVGRWRDSPAREGLAHALDSAALSPAERTAWLPHDIFGVAFDEISVAVGRSPAAVRQLASRGRRHIRGARPRFPVTQAE